MSDKQDKWAQIIEADRNKAAEAGWEEIDAAPIWDRFYADFNFRSSIKADHWPGITEPIPSVTYYIGHYYQQDEPEFTAACAALEPFYLGAFRANLLVGEKVIALDWQHPCYEFNPHQDHSYWPISPLPNGDYYIFLTPDLSGGFFGHPWEQTICVMGQGFVDCLDRAPEFFLRHKLRENRQPV